jgi:putative protease
MQFPLNLKDNSAWFDLREIAEAGVDSIKIEGRIKKFHYVYTVVESFRKQLLSLHNENSLSNDNGSLHKVFNRDFSNGYLKGDINRNMFIDNPRDNSAAHLAELSDGTSDEAIENAEKTLYEEKGGIRSFVQGKIDQLSVETAPVTITISGNLGTPLKIAVETPDSSFVISSEMNLAARGEWPLNLKELLKRFKAINET